MPLRHEVPLAPSVSLRLCPSPCHKRNEQSNFHSPYTLPSSVSHKSFACHSYENTGGVGVFFPFWNSSLSVFRLAWQAVRSSLNLPAFKSANAPTSLGPIPFLSISLRTLLHLRKTQLFSFQELPHSLPKTTRGGGRAASSTFGRSDLPTFRRIPDFPKSAIFSIP
jgi:hypothetical protein